MDKSLILTGWSKPEYAAAAAAALEALKDQADVAGVSMNQLAVVMSTLGPKYSVVYVLGVGLTTNIPEILKTLKTLKAKKVKTVWLSSLPVASDFSAEVCIEGADPAERGFDELIDAPRDSLVDVVAEYFGTLDQESIDYYRAYTAGAQDSKSVVAQYQTLVLAAGYAHRTHKDDWVYVELIKALRLRKPPADWPKKVRGVYEEYVRYGRRNLLGSSKAISDIREWIKKAAKYERARVLITGPSGTGKETVAQHIHVNSPRRKGNFIAFNCASVTPNLLEDRFFGHEKGAFTGADRQTQGLFELADHGTLFLDEIGEMPLEAQSLLLRALEEGKIIRVGGTSEVDVDVRLVTATNRNLPRMVREGKFRGDLYQRISTIVFDMPPLAGRKEDIREIADSWWLDICWQHLSEEQLDALCDYNYPGNVRELINILDRAMALGETDFRRLIAEHKRINRDLWENGDDNQFEYPDNLKAATKRHVKVVFDKYDHNLTAAKNALGISLNTLKKYLE